MWERPSDLTVCNASRAIWHGKKGHATGEKMGSMDFRPWCWLRSVRDGPSHAWTERNFCGVQHNSFLRWEGGLLRAGTSCPTIRLFDLKSTAVGWLQLDVSPVLLVAMATSWSKMRGQRSSVGQFRPIFSLLTHRFQSVNLGLFADFLIHLSAEFLEKKFSSANIEAGTWVELFELFLDFFFFHRKWLPISRIPAEHA